VFKKWFVVPGDDYGLVTIAEYSLGSSEVSGR
jgi:hypothetical protein